MVSTLTVNGFNMINNFKKELSKKYILNYTNLINRCCLAIVKFVP